MAFSNTYDSTPPGPGSGVSNREDLTDVLTILAPEETPVLSSASKQKASATFVEWTVDALSAPSSTGIREGADVTFDANADVFSGRARLGNYIQKFRRYYQVSDLQEAVESVGPAKVAQAEAKSIRELKRDIEKTLCGTQDRAVENGTDTAYALRGLGDWIDSAGPSDVPSGFRTPADSIHAAAEGAFTETVLNNLITSIFRKTGTSNNLTMVADTAVRRIISDFARTAGVSGTDADSVRTVNYNGDSAQIKLSVEFYQSDHGMISIVNGNPDCMPDTTNKDTAYLINPEYYGVHELIPMGSTRLPNQGGGERGYVDCALTLGVYHPQAHGKIEEVA
jgi:hypothetical protein